MNVSKNPKKKLKASSKRINHQQHDHDLKMRMVGSWMLKEPSRGNPYIMQKRLELLSKNRKAKNKHHELKQHNSIRCNSTMNGGLQNIHRNSEIWNPRNCTGEFNANNDNKKTFQNNDQIQHLF